MICEAGEVGAGGVGAGGVGGRVTHLADVTVAQFVTAIGRVARAKAIAPQPRPAPFYLRGADAAPASDPPPVILP